jgi:hypothetical protein
MVAATAKKILVCVLFCSIMACAGSGSSGSGGGSGNGQLRFLNLIPELKTVYLYIDTNVEPIALEYGVPTEYDNFGRTDVKVRVLVASSPLAIVDKTYSLKSTPDKTLVLFGDPNPNQDPTNYKITPLLINDSHEPTIENEFDLRVINGNPQSKSFDVFVTLPGVPPDRVTPIIKGIGFMGNNKYYSGNESSAVVRFIDPDTNAVLYTSEMIDFEAHRVLTLYYAPGATATSDL